MRFTVSERVWANSLLARLANSLFGLDVSVSSLADDSDFPHLSLHIPADSHKQRPRQSFAMTPAAVPANCGARILVESFGRVGRGCAARSASGADRGRATRPGALPRA